MKPGLNLILVGVGLILAGIVVPVLLILQLLHHRSQDVQFKAPGTIEVTVTNAGRYYLWNDYQTVYEGKVYDRSEQVPDGFEVHIRDEGGHEVEFHNDMSASSSTGSNSRKSIGYVEVEQPAKFEISVSGLREDRVLSFSQLGFLRLFLTIACTSLSVVLGIGGGFILVVVGLIRLLIQKRGANGAS